MSARRPSASVRVAAADQHHRHRVRGVGGVRAAGHGVAHQLAIAVVGGDEQRAARAAAIAAAMRPSPASTVSTALIAAASTPVWPTMSGLAKLRTTRSYRPEPIASTALVGQFRRRHLGLEVVGRDLRRGHHDALLARIGRLLAAVEEIGDVRIFLGLGHADLRAGRASATVSPRPSASVCGANSACMQRVELGAVGGHADGRGEARRRAAREAGEVRLEQRVEDLAASGRRGS